MILLKGKGASLGVGKGKAVAMRAKVFSFIFLWFLDLVMFGLIKSDGIERNGKE